MFLSFSFFFLCYFLLIHVGSSDVRDFSNNMHSMESKCIKLNKVVDYKSSYYRSETGEGREWMY